MNLDVNEIWKPILGYERCYEVSNLGRIKSIKLDHKILKSRNHRVVLCKNGKTFPSFIHELVWRTFMGNIPEGCEILRKVSDRGYGLDNLYCFPINISLQGEVWKAIPNYEGYYEASSLGRIRALHRLIPSKNGFKKWRGRILKPALSHVGYLRVHLDKNGKRKNFCVHSLVLLAFCGYPPDKYQGAHLNGNRVDNRIFNLKYCTIEENTHHRNLHGKTLIGNKQPNAKLNQDKVIFIRLNLEKKLMTQKALAREFGVSQSVISSVYNRQTWNHIK